MKHFRLVMLLAFALGPVCSSPAQFTFPGGLGNQGAGIVIDAEGVVDLAPQRGLSPVAARKQIEQFARSQLSRELITPSSQRVVSLKQIAARLQAGGSPEQKQSAELLWLAGLWRLEKVVFDQTAGDIYLIGPGEAFGPDQSGRMVGQSNGRPVLRLDDLLTVLRRPSNGDRTIGCSIDPRPENMARLQEYLRQNSYPASSQAVQQRFRVMAEVLGPQNIRLWGVPEQSHFAIALVEADLRMKRISMGSDSAGVPGIRSHLSLLKPQGNSLQRWWFVPSYDSIQCDAGKTVFQWTGLRAQLLAQEEISDSTGERSNAASTRQSTEKFARLFSDRFEELASRNPAFSELQGLYDLALAGELIRRHAGPLGHSAWMTVLLDAGRVPLPESAVPRSVPSTSTFRMAGSSLLGLVGGVTMDVEQVIDRTEVNSQLTPESAAKVMAPGQLFGDMD